MYRRHDLNDLRPNYDCIELTEIRDDPDRAQSTDAVINDDQLMQTELQ